MTSRADRWSLREAVRRSTLLESLTNKPQKNICFGRRRIRREKDEKAPPLCLASLPCRGVAWAGGARLKTAAGLDRMTAHVASRSCCVSAVLAVTVFVFMACFPPASSSSRGAAALQRVEMAAMYTAQELQDKPDVTKGAEEDVSTTGLGAMSEREVPTGPDPIHHHGRGPQRRQSP